MLNSNDLYAATVDHHLEIGGGKFGLASFRYEVRQVIDTANLASVVKYRILCTHRVTLANNANSDGFDLTPTKVTQYDNYPALLSLKTALDEPDGLNPKLQDYSPRTLSTAIMMSANHDDGDSASYSQQHTRGSSTSQTNSYDVNVSLGFFGPDPTGSVGGGYSHSTTTTQETSETTGNDHAISHDQSSGESMSVKAWSSYAYLDTRRTQLAWVWSQEYPWDVLQYRSCHSGNDVSIPGFVMKRLFDEAAKPTQVYPPSHLSIFGVDFTMKSTWEIDLPDKPEKHVVCLIHNLDYLSASHGLDQSSRPYVRLTAAPACFKLNSPPLDLTLLGLDPIRHGDDDNGAAIGFNGGRFLIKPTAETFKILSSSNNLHVTGSGFDPQMRTDFSHGDVKLKVQFKIIDDDYQYSLFLKHWKTKSTGCSLSIACNDHPPITHRVDDKEGSGGSNNLLALSLRNTDFSSVDYHDYLVIGANQIVITIMPSGKDSGYALRALAIGES